MKQKVFLLKNDDDDRLQNEIDLQTLLDDGWVIKQLSPQIVAGKGSSTYEARGGCYILLEKQNFTHM